jgi:hypothetical protein
MYRVSIYLDYGESIPIKKVNMFFKNKPNKRILEKLEFQYPTCNIEVMKIQFSSENLIVPYL